MQSATITQDAWVLYEAGEGLPSDYFIKTTYSETIAQDAFIFAPGTGETITCDAYICIGGEWSDWCEWEMRVPISVQLTSDYFIMLPVYTSLPEDAYIMKPGEGVLTSDYFIKQTYEKLLNSDYQVRSSSTKPCIVEAEVITPEICEAEVIKPEMEEVEYLDKPVICYASTLSYRECND